MDRRKSYTGIDYARLLAAFLIIAIHTSPLLSYSELGDFILTRIVARTAVPFFFMTSGFFLITRYSRDAMPLINFMKKTAAIYLVAIVIYIPINIYNGYFAMDYFLPNLLKDIVFDGTLYHLWYLPAAIIGAAIAWILVRKFGFRKAFLVTLLLYIMGLLGDSYYGVVSQIPVMKHLYEALFTVSDYTRNGIFFAPVFFVMGGAVADGRAVRSLRQSLCGLGISGGLLLAEGLVLHFLKLQRHDSMYLFLLPCMYCLFCSLTFWKGRRRERVRSLALVIYILHPMVIVMVRMGAKMVHMEQIFIENSLVHYLVVGILSAAGAYMVTLLLSWGRKCTRRRRQLTDKVCQRAWIELSEENLRHNVRTLRMAMPDGCELMAVVKAGAYGHGDFEIATAVNKMGVNAFAVATIEEGIRLRKYGITGEILILGFTSPSLRDMLHRYDLTQTLIDYDYARRLNRQGCQVKAHIKIDTGMHRLGFDAADTGRIAAVFSMKHIKITGIYSHLCVADSQLPEDVDYTGKQIEAFEQVLQALRKLHITIPKTHIQSSYGFLNYPMQKYNYVRAGVALYGVSSSYQDETKLKLDLRPVLSLKSQIVLLRRIKSGESVGYGRTFVAARDSIIAVLPIGYADGLPRNLSGENGSVLVRGMRMPIIGRVCMDQLMIDVTDVKGVSLQDEATLIGTSKEAKLSAAEVAGLGQTISNELLSRMGSRLTITTG